MHALFTIQKRQIEKGWAVKNMQMKENFVLNNHFRCV